MGNAMGDADMAAFQNRYHQAKKNLEKLIKGDS